MPQPFVYRHGMGDLTVGTDALIGRQFLAEQVGVIAIHWAHVENVLSRCFTWMFKEEEAAAFEIYHAIIDREARNRAFLAAAAVRLPNEIIKEAEALFALVRKGSSERNKVVHGVWGRVDARLSSVLLVDQKSLNAVFANMSKTTARDSVELLSNVKFAEYKIRDFQNITARIDKLLEKSTVFSSRILSQVLTGDPTRLSLSIRPSASSS